MGPLSEGAGPPRPGWLRLSHVPAEGCSHRRGQQLSREQPRSPCPAGPGDAPGDAEPGHPEPSHRSCPAAPRCAGAGLSSSAPQWACVGTGKRCVRTLNGKGAELAERFKVSGLRDLQLPVPAAPDPHSPCPPHRLWLPRGRRGRVWVRRRLERAALRTGRRTRVPALVLTPSSLPGDRCLFSRSVLPVGAATPLPAPGRPAPAPQGAVDTAGTSREIGTRDRGMANGGLSEEVL